jgi:dihydrodiol dehydrogenase / D-xylose 1-dehydrogenase (NADP)
MPDEMRWGILGPGSIAHRFAAALQGTPGARLLAVGSRSADRAALFAREHGAERSYGSYDDLVTDPDVDVIYIANPHPFHAASSILCLEHGKAVLCEKPFTVSAPEAIRVVETARRRNVFAMEGMWTRFFPALQQVRRWINEGRIGEVRAVQADLANRFSSDPTSRMMNPSLAGGALLDLGIYVVSFASFVMQREPVSIVAQMHRGKTGVDEQTAMLLKYDNGAIASLFCGNQLTTRRHAMVFGTEGWIELPGEFRKVARAYLHAGHETIEFNEPHRVNGFEYEVMEVNRCLRDGLIESPVLPHSEIIAIMNTLDAIRDQQGLVYPFE